MVRGDSTASAHEVYDAVMLTVQRAIIINGQVTREYDKEMSEKEHLFGPSRVTDEIFAKHIEPGGTIREGFVKQMNDMFGEALKDIRQYNKHLIQR